MSDELDRIRIRIALETARNKIAAARFRREKMFIVVDALIDVGKEQGRAALLETLSEINQLVNEGLACTATQTRGER